MIRLLSNKKIPNKGFSVIELVVVLTIFAIMSSVSIFNYNDYRKNIQKTNVSQDIALSIRQAQVYGISSSDRIVGDIDLDNPSTADELFGEEIANITRDQSIRGVAIFPELKRIVLFEDVNRNFIYNDTGAIPDRIIDERTIMDGTIGINGIYLCPSSESNCDNLQTERVDITFKRPYPEAYISYNGNRNDTYEFATLVISSGTGQDHYIKVSSIGNISLTDEY